VTTLPPTSCLAFEDSAVGLAAARGAGLPVVVTISDYTAHQDFSGALLVTDHRGDDGLPARCLQSISPGLELARVDLATLSALRRRWLEASPASRNSTRRPCPSSTPSSP
jgi:beta-phosphoglucomutase-like phosphatase (HAD superfamily)